MNELQKSVLDIHRAGASPVFLITGDNIVTNTAKREGDYRGLIASSVVSLSIAKPKLAFNVRKESSFVSCLAEGQSCLINALSAEQKKLSEELSTPQKKLSELLDAPHWSFDKDTGLPYHSQSLGFFSGRCAKLFDIDDHWLVVFEIESAHRLAQGSPLLYHDRNYHSLGDIIP